VDATRLRLEKILSTSSVGRQEIPQGSRAGSSGPGMCVKKRVEMVRGRRLASHLDRGRSRSFAYDCMSALTLVIGIHAVLAPRSALYIKFP
jgi:hypothetical protein